MTAQPTDLTHLSVAQFIESVAAKTPTPGGGSVAGVAGALGAALAQMALGFTRGRKAFVAHEADYAAIDARLSKARQMFQALLADDVAAYTLYQQASSHSGPDKDETMQLALAAAIDVPREMTALSLAVLADIASLGGRCNPWLASDLAAGAILAESVVRLCDHNVRVNAAQYTDRPAIEEVLQASQRDCRRAAELLAQIESAVRAAK